MAEYVDKARVKFCPGEDGMRYATVYLIGSGPRREVTLRYRKSWSIKKYVDQAMQAYSMHAGPFMTYGCDDPQFAPDGVLRLMWRIYVNATNKDRGV